MYYICRYAERSKVHILTLESRVPTAGMRTAATGVRRITPVDFYVND